MAVDVWDEDGRPVREEKGELVCVRPFPSMPVGFWNDPDGDEVSRRLFRALRQRLVPRRLRRVDAPWRHDHPWPLGRDAQSRRRQDRHRRDLQPGRADAARSSRRSASARTGTATCVSSSSSGWPRGSSSTRSSPAAIKARIRSGASPRHVPAKIVAVARHSADEVGQDHRACGARRRPRPAGQEQGGARQSRGARSLCRPSGTAFLRCAAGEAASARCRYSGPAAKLTKRKRNPSNG